MENRIQSLRSFVTGNIPPPSTYPAGVLGVNFPDRKIYAADASEDFQLLSQRVLVYSPTRIYAVEDLCIESDTLYRCTTAVSTPEAFDPAKWTIVGVSVSTGILRNPPVSDNQKITIPNPADSGLTIQAAVGQTAPVQAWIDDSMAALLQVLPDRLTHPDDANLDYWELLNAGGLNLRRDGFSFFQANAETDRGVKITSLAATNKPLEIQGALSQTADLLALYDDTFTLLARFDNAGVLRGPAADLTAIGAAEIPLQVSGATAQTAHLQDWKDDGGSVLSFIDAAGVYGGVLGGPVYQAPAAGTNQNITAADVADTPLTLVGAGGQTADLFVAENFALDASGYVDLLSGALADTPLNITIPVGATGKILQVQDDNVSPTTYYTLDPSGIPQVNTDLATKQYVDGGGSALTPPVLLPIQLPTDYAVRIVPDPLQTEDLFQFRNKANDGFVQVVDDEGNTLWGADPPTSDGVIINAAGSARALVASIADILLNQDPAEAIRVDALGAAVVPLTLQGAVGQTANLQEWANSSLVTVTSIGPDGELASPDIVATNPARTAAEGVAVSTINVNPGAGQRGLAIHADTNQIQDLFIATDDLGNVVAQIENTGAISQAKALVTKEYADGLLTSAMIRAVFQNAHGFSVGEALYFDGALWQLARADALATIGTHLVYAVDGANDFKVVSSGYIPGLVGLVPGDWYYVSNTVAGALTNVIPNSDFSNPMLLAISATEGWMFPYRASGLTTEDPLKDVRITSTVAAVTPLIVTGQTNQSEPTLLVNGVAGQTAHLQDWDDELAHTLVQIESGNVGALQVNAASGNAGYVRADGPGTVTVVRDGRVAAVPAQAAAALLVPDASTPGIYIQADNVATANFLDCRDSADTQLMRVGSDGRIESTDGNNLVQLRGDFGSGYFLKNSESLVTINLAGVGFDIDNSSDRIASRIAGASGQTVNLSEWRDNAASLIARVTASGNVGGVGAYTNLSDVATKERIADLELGLEEILKLRPREFSRKGRHERELGFVAQEVRDVLPNSVVDWSDSLLGLRTEEIIPVLVRAVQELAAKIGAK